MPEPILCSKCGGVHAGHCLPKEENCFKIENEIDKINFFRQDEKDHQSCSLLAVLNALLFLGVDREKLNAQMKAIKKLPVELSDITAMAREFDVSAELLIEAREKQQKELTPENLKTSIEFLNNHLAGGGAVILSFISETGLKTAEVFPDEPGKDSPLYHAVVITHYDQGRQSYQMIDSQKGVCRLTLPELQDKLLLVSQEQIKLISDTKINPIDWWQMPLGQAILLTRDQPAG